MPRSYEVTKLKELFNREQQKFKDMDNFFYASVSLILTHQNLLESDILFIKRATNPNDPWSGHFAFPGGGYDLELDKGYIQKTASRETKEEVGVELKPENFIGSLGEIVPSNKIQGVQLSLSSFVYFKEMSQAPLFYCASEVSGVYLIPLRDLLSPQNYIRTNFETFDKQYKNLLAFNLEYNGEEVIIWGLTLKIIFKFFKKIERVMAELGVEIERDFSKIDEYKT